MPGDAPRPCPGCGSRSRCALGAKSGHELLRCRACGTVFVGWLPSPEAACDYDAYYDESNLTVPAFVDRRLDEIVAGLNGYRRTNRWLDIGCGAGALLHASRRAGWEAEGTEISPAAIESLAAQGDAVHLGDVMTLPLAATSYDVVSLVEVLEHVPHPRAMLERAWELLRPGGILYLTTPHGRGISARLLGLRWSVVAPPEHLQLVSLGGLRRALAEVGFERVVLRTRGVNPHELVRVVRLLRRAGAGSMGGGERVRTSYQLNAALESSRSGVRLKQVANATLGILRLGDSLSVCAVRPRALDQDATDRSSAASSGAQRR